MTNPAAVYEVKVSPVLSAGVYKDTSNNYYELVITYIQSDDDPAICEKSVLAGSMDFAGLLCGLYHFADFHLRDYDGDEDIVDLLNRIEKDAQHAKKGVSHAIDS